MFAPLQVNSTYSLLNSPLRVHDYVARGKELGYQALGLADVNVLYGALAFYRECRKQGIKPLIGLTVSFMDQQRYANPYQILLYAKNYRGYQALMVISTLMKKDNTKTQKEIEAFIFKQTKDLFVILEANYGPHIQAIKKNEPNQAQKMLHYYKENVAAHQLYIGVNAQANEHYHLNEIVHLATSEALPLIATPKISYLKTNEKFAQVVLQAIEGGEKIEHPEEILQRPGIHYLESAHDYQQKYQELQVLEAYEQVSSLVSQIDLTMPENELLLPEFPLPQGYRTAKEMLKDLAWKGLAKRQKDTDSRYTKRLAYELSVIHEMGYDDYFLIVWDVLDFARREKMTLGFGRGSAAGSLVAYVLEITGVDPIANQLLFERFLNPERQNMPDIDIDFPDNKRQAILEYVHAKYGEAHVAQIATFGTFAARKALRDVGTVLNKSQDMLSRWANTVPNELNVKLHQVYEQSKALRDLIASEPYGELWYQTACQIEGLPRHVSTHAAGVIISKSPLLEHIPLQNGSHGIANSQFTMGDVESLGLLKMDFLSLINLTILHESLKQASRLANQELDPDAFNREDPEVFALFQRMETNGIFQFESNGIRQVLRRVKPQNMEDLAAVNALFRPGPMQQIDHFVKRKHGQEKIEYPHDDLKTILGPTYGIMVYQEQVMQVTQKIAGFSLGEADILRRAISKKNQETMNRLAQQFIDGAIQRGYDRETAHQIYSYIEAFANYGFNKSHAFAYSYLAYSLAWLKVKYPVAFYYGNLSVTNAYDKKGKQLILEAKQAGVSVLPPNVNTSYTNIMVKGHKSLQFGLRDIKGLPRAVAFDIINERQANGSFKDLYDFVNRVSKQAIKKEVLERLTWSGAFDCFGETRQTLIEEAIPKLLAHIKVFGQTALDQTTLTLDHTVEESELFRPEIIPQSEYEDRELMRGELETLGQTLTINPYEKYETYYKHGIIQPISALRVQMKVAIIGEIIELKRITTKKGDPMAFVTLEDASGQISLTLFPSVYIDYASRIRMGHKIYCFGEVESRQGRLQLIVRHVKALSDELIAYLDHQLPRVSHPQNVVITVANRKAASEKKKALLQLVKANPGQVPITFRMQEENVTYDLGPNYGIHVNEKVRQVLYQIYGKAQVFFE